MLSFTACVDGKSGEFYALDVCSISYMNLKMHWNQSEVIHSSPPPRGPTPPIFNTVYLYAYAFRFKRSVESNPLLTVLRYQVPSLISPKGHM